MQVMRDAIEREAGKRTVEETVRSAEDQSMDVVELEESQDAFAEYVAS
jgi:hypothetical protein